MELSEIERMLANRAEESSPRPRRACTVPGCGREYRQNGYCGGHYMRHVRGMPLDTPFRKRRRAGRPPEPCSVSQCYRDAKTKGLCAAHYRRKRLGDPDWLRPLKAYNAGGTTRDLTTRLKCEDADLFTSEAERMGMDRAELIRTVLERWAREVRKGYAARAEMRGAA